MRVLLTGGAGFVGMPLVRELVTAGHEVYAIVRPGLSASTLRQFVPDERCIVGDLGEPRAWRRRLDAIALDACIHVAWRVAREQYQTSVDNLQSLADSMQLLDGLIASGCPRIIGVGTCYEYEFSNTPLREDAPLAPSTLYATCKRALSDVLERLATDRRTGWAWARLFYVYGPGDRRERLIPSAIRAFRRGDSLRVSSPGAVRDYLHVADVATALRRVLETGAEGSINIGSGQAVTVQEIAQTTATLLRAGCIDVPAAASGPGEPSYICADTTRLRGLGWRQQFSLIDGLQNTIACQPCESV